MTKLLQYGSQGGDVKTLQESLNKNGYNLTTDGIFGKNTLSAVKDYQSKNGLTVDGMVGTQTQSKLNGALGNKTPTPKTPTSTVDSQDNSNEFKYDDFSHPEYTSQWDTQLKDVMEEISKRNEKGFSYDVTGDALYQQYKDMYIQQGKMAMQDTMGQAAAMTGGYGNSYAASVGNQAYQASLSQLNNVIPELYQMAYDRYAQEGQDLLNQYSMYADRENTDYSRFTDDRNFKYGEYADNKSYAYNEYRNAIADDQWKASFDEGVRQFDETMAFNTANANVEKDTKTGTYTPKATSPTLDAKGYQGLLTDAATYADMGEEELAIYLHGMIGRGITQEEMDNIMELYFPTSVIPGAKKQGNNTSYWNKYNKTTTTMN